jgi:hypothetical protein
VSRHHRWHRVRVLIGCVGVALALAGCARPGGLGPPGAPGGPASATTGTPDNGSTPPTAASDRPTGGATPDRPVALPTVVIHRTGGFVGVDQRLTVSSTGDWTFADRDTGARATGTLTATQRAELAQLATDPGLVAEARSSSGSICNDGYEYAIGVGEVSFRLADCGGTEHPRFDALIGKLSSWTPL